MAKKKMAGGDIKIKLADEGGRINWVEEVEEEDPLGARVPPPSGWSTVEVVKKKPAEKVKEVRKELERERLNILRATTKLTARKRIVMAYQDQG